jgi:hypothetical protein
MLLICAYVGIIININLSRSVFIYSHASVSADSVSVVSVTAVYHALPHPPKKLEN